MWLEGTVITHAKCHLRIPCCNFCSGFASRFSPREGTREAKGIRLAGAVVTVDEAHNPDEVDLILTDCAHDRLLALTGDSGGAGHPAGGCGDSRG